MDNYWVDITDGLIPPQILAAARQQLDQWPGHRQIVGRLSGLEVPDSDVFFVSDALYKYEYVIYSGRRIGITSTYTHTTDTSHHSNFIRTQYVQYIVVTLDELTESVFADICEDYEEYERIAANK